MDYDTATSGGATSDAVRWAEQIMERLIGETLRSFAAAGTRIAAINFSKVFCSNTLHRAAGSIMVLEQWERRLAGYIFA